LGKKRLKTVQSDSSYLVGKIVLLALIVLVVVGVGFGAYVLINQAGSGGSNSGGGSSQYRISSVPTNKILLVTSMGNITIELYADMPITSENFKNLTKLGIYDGTIFHRVVKGFVVQGGDPTGTGMGDPSIARIPDELPNKHSNVRGSVAMAKTSEPNSATSQFYINLVDNSANLDSNYSVFGRVTKGMDVVDKIANVAVDENDRPLSNVTLIRALFLEE
jgi:peptidylprolyl isomerase